MPSKRRLARSLRSASASCVSVNGWPVVSPASERMSASGVVWFPWTRTYQRDEWLDQLLSRSDHTALEPAVRDRLWKGIGVAIDDHGGSFVMNFETVLITATRLG